MNEVKKLCFLIFVLFLICFLFFNLDKNEILEIKHQGFKSFVYFGNFILSFFSIIFSFLSFEKNKLRILFSSLPILAFIQILSLGIINTLFSASSWKTQTIIYQNKFDESKKVEFQMYDIGFSGYHKRTIEVNYITDWFFVRKEVENYNSDWVKINKEVNELQLEY